MSGNTNASIISVSTEHLAPPRLAQQEESAKLEVNVIFTTDQGTLAALKAAGRLASGLNTRINVLDVQAVPLAFPISRPPIAIAFSLHRLQNLAREGISDDAQINIQLCLCRDKQQALLKALSPRSLVLIGGKRIWWLSKAKSIARMLERHGYRVVFAVQR
jgi:hypothetical protein